MPELLSNLSIAYESKNTQLVKPRFQFAVNRVSVPELTDQLLNSEQKLHGAGCKIHCTSLHGYATIF